MPDRRPLRCHQPVTIQFKLPCLYVNHKKLASIGLGIHDRPDLALIDLLSALRSLQSCSADVASICCLPGEVMLILTAMPFRTADFDDRWA